MITKYDLSRKLISKLEPFYINIMIDFLNNFYNTFKVLSKSEMIRRINKLEYVGYENKSRGYICDDDKACFGSGFYYYIAVNSDIHNKDEIKAYVYHELIHCLSIHNENNIEVNGYKRPFYINPIFDEIITEFYAHTLLMKENINFRNKFVYEESNDYKLYAEYNGCGYHEYMGLAKLYDYIFNKNLLKGKFINNDYLRKEVENIIFNDNLDFDYNEFINCNDSIKRYYDVTLLFISKLKTMYNNSNKEQIVNDKNIPEFLNLIIKEESDNNIKPYKDLDIMIFNEIYKYLCSQTKRKII